ncbi:MAG: BatD family protein [Alphaproteobacteria bacterium]
MKKIILILTVFLSFTTQAFAENFVAATNRNVVTTDEVFMLTLTYDGHKIKDEPDLSVLKDFTIFSTTQSFQERNENGVMSYSKEWQIMLSSSNQDGTITIPAITLGNLYTAPISIKIDNNISNPEERANSSNTSSQQNTDVQKHYSLQAQVSEDTPYIQQQVNYKLILTDEGNLQISAPYFSDADQKDWTIKSLGDPTLNIINKDGKKLREITFKYAIFPQKSGEIKLPQARIDGYYVEKESANQRANTFGSFFPNSIDISDIFGRKIPVRLITKNQSINVLAKPQLENTTWWFPAKEVKLSAKIETSSENFKVGEAINRKVYLEAKNVIDSQIPNIDLGTVTGAKQYPEKPITNSYAKGDDILTITEINDVYIPNQAGNLVLPEVVFYWFNTQTKTLEKTILATETLLIKPNPTYQDTVTAQPDPAVDVVQATTNLLPEQNENALNNLPATAVSSDKHEYDYFFLAAAIFFGIFIGLIMGKKSKKTVSSSNNNSAREIDKKSVISAAQCKDIRLLRESLIQWAIERYGDDKILNLNDVSKYVKNKDFEKELEILSASLYAKDINEWTPKNFIESFEKENKNRVTKYNDNQILPNLYK